MSKKKTMHLAYVMQGVATEIRHKPRHFKVLKAQLKGGLEKKSIHELREIMMKLI